MQTVPLIVASAVAMIFISLTRGYALLRVEGKLDFSTQAAVWDRLLNLPTTFFRNYSAGDLAYRSLAISQIRAILTGCAHRDSFGPFFPVQRFPALLLQPRFGLVAIALAGAALAVRSLRVAAVGLQRQVAETAARSRA